MAEEDYDLAEDADQVIAFGDPVAARTFAYLALMESVDAVNDAKLRREGLDMLKRVRLSIRALSDAPLASVK